MTGRTMYARTHQRSMAEGPARALVRSWIRHDALAVKHRRHADRDEADLTVIRNGLERRLGIDLAGVDHDDGWLYDVLHLVEVDMTTTDLPVPRRDRPWRWLGTLNNHSSAVIRKPRAAGSGEISAPRYIATRLGVIPEDYSGQLYRPVTDPLDINPWHLRPARKHQ